MPWISCFFFNDFAFPTPKSTFNILLHALFWGRCTVKGIVYGSASSILCVQVVQSSGTGENILKREVQVRCFWKVECIVKWLVKIFLSVGLCKHSVVQTYLEWSPEASLSCPCNVPARKANTQFTSLQNITYCIESETDHTLSKTNCFTLRTHLHSIYAMHSPSMPK